MPSFQELRDRTVESLGEYRDQAVETPGGATFSDEVVLRRLKMAYRRIREQVRRRAPGRFAQIVTFSYPADAESMDLATVSPSLVDANFLALGLEDNATAGFYPIQFMGPREVEALSIGSSMFPGGAYGFYTVGNRLFLQPRPTQERSLRATAVLDPDLSAITTSTWGADTPPGLPAAHHEIVAVEAALSFARQGDPPRGLREERDELLQSLYIWATSSRTALRNIQEVY